MSGNVEQRGWVERVLRIEFRGAGSGAARAHAGAALPVWQQAKDAVDGQLNQLYDALKRTGIPGLATFADQVEATLGPFRVGLVTALAQYDQAAGPAKEKPRTVALDVIGSYRNALDSDRISAAETNPFGVQVTIRSTLGQALDQLQKHLANA